MIQIKSINFLILFLVFLSLILSCNDSGSTGDNDNYSESYTLLRYWGTEGTSPGEYLHPVFIDLDNLGYAYVVEWGDAEHSPPSIYPRIHRVNTLNGSFVSWLGTYGTNPEEYQIPYGVTVYNGNIYLADSTNDRILKYDSGGILTSWLGKAEDYSTGWHDYFSTISTLGDDDGQFFSPVDIDFDSEGNMYVAEMGNSRIQKFDTTGNYLGWWGGSEESGAGWHPAGSGLTPKMGSGDGEFMQPLAIAIDKNDFLYVADYFNHRVQKFSSSEGDFLLKWGSLGFYDDTKFFAINGISVDTNCDVYVVDTGMDRIKKFNSSGDLITAWGEHGTDPGQFNGPIGIDIDTDGTVYIVDCDNHRIQVFEQQ